MIPTPKVSVCMITFRHADFISEAIEGILIQQTKFEVEIIIGEDFGGDETRIICEQYANKYPDKITLLPSSENLGMMKNFVRTVENATGSYIALCEGDDYWTDPLKLQKQVDFMELNQDVSLCFHNSEKIIYGKKEENSVFSLLRVGEYTPTQILKNFIIPTASVVFRKKDLVDPNFLLDPRILFGDICLWLHLLDSGKAVCLEDNMSVYRIHTGSVTTKKLDKLQFQKYLNHYDYLSEKYSDTLGDIINTYRNTIFWVFSMTNFRQKKLGLGLFYLLQIAIRSPLFVLKQLRDKIKLRITNN